MTATRSKEPVDVPGTRKERSRLGGGSSTNVTAARLSWWRSQCAEAFRKSDAERTRVSLRACAANGNSRWDDAIEGDVAAAVGIALRTVWRREHLGISEDAALSAVLACALDGDATAAFLLSAALDRRAVDVESLQKCAAAAHQWDRRVVLNVSGYGTLAPTPTAQIA